MCGSGSTWWATHEKSNDPDNVTILFADKINASDEWISHIVKNFLVVYDRILVDGLFTENGDVFNLLNNLHKVNPEADLIVHFWVADKQQCIINDRARNRIISAVPLIEHMELDDPRNSKEILKLAKVIIHQVYKEKVIDNG